MKRLNSSKVRDNTSSTEYIIYADPPYYGTENMYKTKSFSIEDHYTLANLCNESTHHIIISYNDCELVRELYEGWNFLELTKYSTLSKGKFDEVLISNKPLIRHIKGNRTKSSIEEWMS
jgi:DNA adenine methylase